jgi:two-component system, OmpR family, heavy metal sensor histidine kinase CusS
MKRLSIGMRLTLWYLAIFALGQLVFGTGMWLILRNNIYDMVDDDLETEVDDLTSFLESQKADAPLSKLQDEVKATYSIEHSGDYFALYNENGDLIYHSATLPASPAKLTGSEQIKHPAMWTRTIDGHPIRFIREKFSVNQRVYVVLMGIPADDAIETLNLFRAYLFMFAPALFVLAAGLGYWMSRRALSPVDELVRTAREIGGTNLSSRLRKLNTGDELQRLSDTLNEMLDRIESAFLRVTQFTADASHELRTPVSLVRTEAELALRRSRTEKEYQESLRHILLAAERTTVLIEQLLSLARADSGRETLNMQSVNLSETLCSIAESWKQVAAIRDLNFSTSVDDRSAFVTADETLLRRLVDILLDNAFKYTVSPGTVSLMLENRGDVAVIMVQDSGVGIPQEEQSKIFERFYRIDKARNRAQGGTGLGLAIAQWIVSQHRGSIKVESRPGEGSIFRVELPRILVPETNHQPV